MYVLVASNSGTAAPVARVPDELKAVLTQLRETRNYRTMIWPLPSSSASPRLNAVCEQRHDRNFSLCLIRS